MSRVIWQHIPFVDEDVIVGRGGRSSHNDLWNSQGGDFFSTFSSPDSFVSFTITSVWQIGCWHFQTLAGFKLFSTFPGFWFPQQGSANFPTLKIKKSKAHPTYQQSKFIQGASIYAESLWLSSKISCEDVLRFRIYAYSRSFDLPLVGSNWVTSFKVYVPEFLLQPVA